MVSGVWLFWHGWKHILSATGVPRHSADLPFSSVRGSNKVTALPAAVIVILQPRTQDPRLQNTGHIVVIKERSKVTVLVGGGD